MGVWLLRVQEVSAWVFLVAFLVRHHAPVDTLPGALNAVLLGGLWAGGAVHAAVGLFQLVADVERLRAWRSPLLALLAVLAGAGIVSGLTTSAGGPPHRSSTECQVCHRAQNIPASLHQPFGCQACHQRPAVTEVGCATCHPRPGDLHGDVTARFPALLEPGGARDIHGLGCGSCHAAPPGR
jgi:succinate dehydrogenase hydrophobic anchor subunit